jgi:hypothetical protein
MKRMGGAMPVYDTPGAAMTGIADVPVNDTAGIEGPGTLINSIAGEV